MGRWRWAAVAAIFLTSLAALAAVGGLAVWGADEAAAQDRLRAAAVDLAAAVGSAGLPPDESGVVVSDGDNARLAEAGRAVLGSRAGTEGGVYLPRSDQFAGAVVQGPGPHDKAARRDPPPLETASIRQLCRDAAAAGAVVVGVWDVGPSRVAVAAAPVESGTPAAVWVMARLSGPAEQKARLARLQVATGLALLGVLVALGLAAGLARSLARETARREGLRDDLRRAEHLASLGRLLAGVAHEVRNPLAAIRSTVQLWERLPAQARTPESVAAVVGAVDRLNDLVGRLLLFARAGHEARRPVDLNAVAAETVELLRARADAQGVAVGTELSAGLPSVPGADAAVRQAVLNLATNALQATPPGGRVTFRTRPRPGAVELSVADTGPGVPPGDRDRLFEPFFTTRPDGTGLAAC